MILSQSELFVNYFLRYINLYDCILSKFSFEKKGNIGKG